MAEKKSAPTTLGAIERSFNAISPYNLFYTAVVQPLLNAAAEFKHAQETGQVSPGGGLAMAAPAMTGGLLAAPGGTALGAGLLRSQLDPHGISAVKLNKPWTEIDVVRQQNVPMVPKNTMTPEEFYAANKGGVLLPAPGDKSVGGMKVSQIEGTPVDVQTHGGGSFMRTHSPYGAVWASELSPSSKLSNQIKTAQEKFGTDNVLITHATMGPRAADFSHHVSDALLGQLKGAKISRAGQAAIKERMAKGLVESAAGGSKRYTYPDFPGIFSPRLPAWLDKSGYRRKHFVKLMDSREMQEAGVPSVAAARLAVTDVRQLEAPDLGSGMSISRAYPGLLTEGTMPHPSYPVQTPGHYVGSLGEYLPVGTMFPDWVAANSGKQNMRRAFEIGGADRAQVINQRWLDQLMPQWLLQRQAR